VVDRASELPATQIQDTTIALKVCRVKSLD
jgi:hypothetical protein